MDSVYIFKDVAGEWRWTRKAANGRIVADSSEGYANKEDCVSMALKINKGAEVFVEGVSIARIS